MIYSEKIFEKRTNNNKTKVLLIGESVSLAHVTRPHELARQLDSDQHEIHFASGSFHPLIKKIKETSYHSIFTLSPNSFFEKIAKGKPVYDKQTIRDYVQAELKLISKIAPDIIVADNRPTLQISAALTSIPFINLCNAHWGPYSTLTFPIPDIPITRLYGENLSKIIIPKIIPGILKQHIRAFREMQKYWGLKPVASIQEMYTGGTITAYMDTPELSPTKDLPNNHVYLGPILWEPETNLDSSSLDLSKSIIYLSMGSSGDQTLTKGFSDFLISQGYQVICSGNLPTKKGLLSAEFIPGIQASQLADIIICHGGSGTIYQGLSAGKPIIGICKNPDQQFVMQGVEKFGAGITFKSRFADNRKVINAIHKIENNRTFSAKALEASIQIKKMNPNSKFTHLINSLETLIVKQGA